MENKIIVKRLNEVNEMREARVSRNLAALQLRPESEGNGQNKLSEIQMHRAQRRFIMCRSTIQRTHTHAHIHTYACTCLVSLRVYE